MTGEVLPYDEVGVELTDAQAAALVVRLFPSEEEPHEIVVTGTCPRCNHSFRFVDPLDRLRSAAPMRADAPGERPIVVLCRCGERHPDPADDKVLRTNCGASFALAVRWGT